MILSHTEYKIDTLISLGVIILVLTSSIVWSLFRPASKAESISSAPKPNPRLS
jgi:hypothetical protein